MQSQSTEPTAPTPRSRAWWAGAILQGLILGAATAVAIFNLLEASSGAQVFRYQGF